MALQYSSAVTWKTFFTYAGIPKDEATQYAEIFATNRLTNASLSSLNKEYLKDLQITVVGDIMAILQYIKAHHPDASGISNAPVSKPPSVKPPTLVSDMTHPQFRKFKIDWEVYKNLIQIQRNQIANRLYSICDDTVQNSIVNTVPNFFDLSEEEIITILGSIVTKLSNPMVYKMKFGNIVQSEGESIKDFLVRLKTAGTDCEFSCPNCEYDLVPINVKDQFVRGLNNELLQTDILAKAGDLKSLEDIVKHAEAFETAVRDQSKLQNTPEVMAARSSEYKKSKRWNNFNKGTKWTIRACTGCGSTTHSSYERQASCPAWGRQCNNCHLPNHFSSVCRREKTDAIQSVSLVAHLKYAEEKNSYTVSTNESITEIAAELTPILRNEQRRTPKVLKIFPDSGASICIAGTKHLKSLGANEEDLIICNKKVAAVGGSRLVCRGWLPVLFRIGDNVTEEALYICDKVDRIYLSRQGCTKTKILPPSYPYPMSGHQSPSINAVEEKTSDQPQSPYHNVQSNEIQIGVADGTTELSSKLQYTLSVEEKAPVVLQNPYPISAEASPSSTIENPTQTRSMLPPPRPSELPFPPTTENVPKLKQYILDSFASTAFNRDAPFPSMPTPPAHIHLKPDAKPYARHVPIPIPFHWKDQVKQSLDNDVKNGIIEPIPIGEPVEWCTTMIVVQKPDGRLRRTIDLQNVNSQCMRETHHCQSPFHLASKIPPGTKKTVLDAVDSFHAVELDEESRCLTNFITEWGGYRYRRLPQGYKAATDAYTRRYDHVIEDVPRKVKIVDDACLNDPDIKEAFYHTWDYLSLCVENGIVISKDKFQFCQDTVTFAGLKITPTGIAPSDHILSAIRDFPTPKDITGARSWFGLVNQVAWANAVSPIMQPFRDLIRKTSTFTWNDNLQLLFESSKQIIISKVKEGVRTFDTLRNTCLQTDWSKTGIGYLLLQQHCNCPLSAAPMCCPEGWKLVHAGSRPTHDRETRYSPTEGEALAVCWSLDHAKMFVLGCRRLIVSTDHKPLLGILGDRDLATITNTRLLGLKEKTLRYTFTIQHNPGKWHRGPDACSRNPTGGNVTECDRENSMKSIVHEAVREINVVSTAVEDKKFITLDDLEKTCLSDPVYQQLLKYICNGFPGTKNDTDPSVREFWEVRHRLSSYSNVALMDNRLVIPVGHRKYVLQTLHSAHQGVSGMQARANASVYWPGMNASIRNTRYTCKQCNEAAPSQCKEPLVLTPAPEYPYQNVCADYFEVKGHTYLSYVDRFSGWISIFHFVHPTTDTLISECRSLFTSYGAPEEFCSDGGPQFTAKKFEDFLTDWGVHHRLSSAGYPQSNGRAEAAVKTSKRIITDNTLPNGSLNTNSVARALLQYHNTPLVHLGLSPAQILFHRNLRDHLPTNPTLYKLHHEWLITAEKREQALAKRNVKMACKYNDSSRDLEPLTVRMEVAIQDLKKGNHMKWDRTGSVVEVLQNRQYRVRLHGSGRIVLRNRRHIKPYYDRSRLPPTIIPSAKVPNNEMSNQTPTLPSIPQPVRDIPPISPGLLGRQSPALINNQVAPTNRPELSNSQSPVQPVDQASIIRKVPRALRNLETYNKPGLAEAPLSQRRRNTNTK